MIYDVAVIGAGLAGLQAARMLAARGLKVVLVDRKESLSDGIHTTGIFVRRTWEDFPLPDEQLGRGIRDVVLYSPRRRALALHAEQDEFRIGRMAWLYLHLVDECSAAGVVWMPGTRLLAIDGDRITVERRRRPKTLQARFVVGADGARSTVARLLGLDTNREMLVGAEEVFASRGAAPPSLHCYLDPKLAPGYIAWVADDGEETHVGTAGYRDRFDPTALRAFRTSLGITAKPAERRGGLIPVGGVLRRLANARGLLVGDAAGAVSPLTAGGFDGSLRLSAFAAAVIAEYLERGDERVLAQYKGERFRPRFITRSAMRRVAATVTHPLLLEAGHALLRTPPLRALAAHVFFGRGSFPDAQPGRDYSISTVTV